MHRLVSVLLGAVIAAAFLGPGTVTTAARAGAGHAYELLWALVFATGACLVLQEASARLTIASGRNLGEALRWRFRRGWSAVAVLWLALLAIILGCAAYQAGNILGGVAGLRLLGDMSVSWLTLVCAVAAGLLLWFGSTRQLAAVLSLLVAVMGAGFLVTSILLRPPVGEVMAGLLLPRIPPASGLLVLGLVGTTVVPYNLFLGSGLARGQSLRQVRFGLAVAIVLGGVISMAVVIVGAAVRGEFSFAEVARVLSGELGAWAAPLFAAGLFAAGFSSAITAPLAAAITARSLLAADPEDRRWNDRSWRYRAVWLAVLATGASFGIAGVEPVPVILLAQVLNGTLLPVAAVFLFVMMNDRRLLADAVNGLAANLVTAAVVAVTVVLGVRGVLAAARSATGWEVLGQETVVLTAGVVTAASVGVFAVRAIVRQRRG
ncbi:MAG: Nramp family divalent metal transporter [Thermoanaerobaculia bacterium]